MIYLIGALIAATASLTLLILTLSWRYQVRLAQEYLKGFRDGQLAEATANHASAPRIAAVRVPLSGVN